MGIERRASRLQAYWKPHLELSKAAQKRWLETAAGKEVAVLGAGRLMDVATDALAKNFDNLWLVDADPLAVTYWKDCAVALRWDICDISGVVKDWVRRIDAVGGGWQKVLDEVKLLPRPKDVAFVAQADGIISLNLLSQIPIVWQDLLEEHLKNRFGTEFVTKNEQQWMDAMIPGAKWLVEAHLEMLEGSGAKQILIIADVNYAYYRNTAGMAIEGAPMPLQWSAGQWSAVAAGATYEVVESLFGVRLDDGDMFRRLMPSYELQWKQVWLWHISPLGLESKKRGTVHRVAAFSLSRITSHSGESAVGRSHPVK